MPQQIRSITSRMAHRAPTLATLALIALPIILAACGKGGGSGY